MSDMSALLSKIFVKVVLVPFSEAEFASVNTFNSVDKTVLIFVITLSTIEEKSKSTEDSSSSIVTTA